MYSYDHIMVRYGELSTKGKNRRDFTNQLVKNIKSKLKGFPALTFDKRFDRLFIHLNSEDALAISESLKDVFGLSSFSMAMKVERDLDVIADVALHFIGQESGSTFKVLSRRHDKSFEHISDTINRHVATKILMNTDYKVDVHSPDINIIIEVRREAAYIMLNKINGLGGYPVGIQGRVLMMLSGGIDSPVASYLMMKRGVEIECVHFQSPPYTSEGALNKVLDLAKTLTKYQHTIRVHVVNFTEIQLDIYNKVPESYAITMMRRFFLRIGNQIAENRHLLAIGNGENLGQVASQTLQSMEAITKFPTLPVLRPLLTYDKIEIINLAESIGTYETSILPFEDCCTIFTPRNPVTKPKAEKIAEYETKFDMDALIEKALENTETIVLRSFDQEETSFL